MKKSDGNFLVNDLGIIFLGNVRDDKLLKSNRKKARRVEKVLGGRKARVQLF